jgi:hypothetical protein
LISPQQSTSTITSLATTKSIGAMIYDSTTNQFKVCTKTGTTTAKFKTVTTSSIV